MSEPASTIDDVLAFWLEPKPRSEPELEARGRVWFGGGPEVDRQITDRFAWLVERARRGELDDWHATFRGTLAFVILLDQFTRNICRGKAEAFASDGAVLALVRREFERGAFDAADSLETLFLALPFSHAEELDAQRLACIHIQRAALRSPPEWKKTMNGAVDFARKHLDVVARFGRFPHRNAVLGRVSTRDETEYLEYLRTVGQWL